ncbi:hypothetical protein GA0115254_11514 [Streptomyces sp. Ncost-T10-10d]|nr:hypothetical protein GA0115254_11514 [Streptomyces sp. Ncost-T10-10d]
MVETHPHNDYVTGGPEPARVTGARYRVPATAEVSFSRVPVADGDTAPVDVFSAWAVGFSRCPRRSPCRPPR